MSKVIACIDNSKAAAPVADYAAWAASRLGAPLMLLHVLDQLRFPVENDLSGSLGIGEREHLLNELAELDIKRNKLALEQGRLILEAAQQRISISGVNNPNLRQRHGDLLESLAELEDETRLLVIGKLGEEHGDTSAFNQVGNNVERVVRKMRSPVLIVQGEFKPPETVMLAFDSSDISREGVELVAKSPLFKGLSGHLVTVGKNQKDLQADLKWAEETIVSHGHTVSTAVLEGAIEPALHAYQKENNIDMIVMGAYSHSRLREFFAGSTTANMIRHASVPHLVLR